MRQGHQLTLVSFSLLASELDQGKGEETSNESRVFRRMLRAAAMPQEVVRAPVHFLLPFPIFPPFLSPSPFSHPLPPSPSLPPSTPP